MTDKYSSLNTHANKVIDEANAEIGDLQTQIQRQSRIPLSDTLDQWLMLPRLEH